MYAHMLLLLTQSGVMQLPTQVMKGVLEGTAPEQLSPDFARQLAQYSLQPGASVGVPQATLQLLQGLAEAPAHTA